MSMTEYYEKFEEWRDGMLAVKLELDEGYFVEKFNLKLDWEIKLKFGRFKRLAQILFKPFLCSKIEETMMEKLNSEEYHAMGLLVGTLEDKANLKGKSCNKNPSLVNGFELYRQVVPENASLPLSYELKTHLYNLGEKTQALILLNLVVLDGTITNTISDRGGFKIQLENLEKGLKMYFDHSYEGVVGDKVLELTGKKLCNSNNFSCSAFLVVAAYSSDVDIDPYGGKGAMEVSAEFMRNDIPTSSLPVTGSILCINCLETSNQYNYFG
ncbi:hypothetical protein ACH5RR_021536 [Cinchona calisaya]|uniref:Uncharacterized protein n=1 Tax=Cinchona calisaya TaxID=153742 RepID=A0ABD2ZKH1_9GENT